MESRAGQTLLGVWQIAIRLCLPHPMPATSVLTEESNGASHTSYNTHVQVNGLRK